MVTIVEFLIVKIFDLFVFRSNLQFLPATPHLICQYICEIQLDVLDMYLVEFDCTVGCPRTAAATSHSHSLFPPGSSRPVGSSFCCWWSLLAVLLSIDNQLSPKREYRAGVSITRLANEVSSASLRYSLSLWPYLAYLERPVYPSILYYIYLQRSALRAG